jgi:TolA-binding protein
MQWRRLARCAPLAPLLSVLAAGCFATRNDVRLVQGSVSNVQKTLEQTRAEAERTAAAAARRDSLLVERLRAVDQTARVVADSLAAISLAIGQLKANVGADMDALRVQLVQIATAAGVSARELQQMRAELDEARRVSRSGTGAGIDPAGMPGPTSLYQRGVTLLQQGSPTIARMAFTDYLDQYPNGPNAADALFQIGVAFAAENDEASADSVYKLVVQKFPTSPRAPSALYKRAYAFEQAGRLREARSLYQQLTENYRTSDESRLAVEALRRIPPG